RGVSGIVNVEITPELTVRLANAFATTMHKGADVFIARDPSKASRALGPAVISALTTSAINVSWLDAVPMPVVRHAVGRFGDGGLVLRTTPGIPDSLDIRLLDDTGADLSADQT